MYKLAFILTLFITGCNEVIKPNPSEGSTVVDADIYAPITVVNAELKGPIKLWATYYNMPTFKSNPDGIAVRDMKGNPLGPKLLVKEWCSLAMEGTGFINGLTYNYAGTTNSNKVTCNHSPSGRVKFYITKYKYGVGNRNNPLRPFISVACDQKKFSYGTRFFIPLAKGVILPNGSKHSGYFVCEDVGGLITGNHIDVFIGASTVNPFKFIKSATSKTFEAYTVK